MDSLSAFAMGELNKGKELMVFDWNKAARIIKDSGTKYACAGLSGDWAWTGGDIFDEGVPVYTEYTYLASTWATPEIEIDGELFDCYLMQSETDGWDADTKWPESALKILQG